ncbi:MAG: inner membrane CreD family protein [Planctomycetota bacterium]|nr:inner membrane CreD family protein [Planctomycetota bacterium]
MTAFRFFLILVIFVLACTAWWALGGTVYWRTGSLRDQLSAEVDSLWGPANLSQPAPYLGSNAERAAPVDPLASSIKVHLEHENRYKGLLWFSTYTVDFAGTYTVKAGPAGNSFLFTLPAGVPFTDNLGLALDGEALDVDSKQVGNRFLVPIPADEKTHAVAVTYRTRGRDRWSYVTGEKDSPRAAHLQDFTLEVTTNFTAINYPEGSMSPSKKAEPTDGGVRAVWKITDSRTSQSIAVDTPAREDAGPIAARMALYAPVGLLFFFTVLFTTMLLKKVSLHPMHYLFISAGFFAFHILLAYLVDKIDIHQAFWVSAAVSVFLVVSYMRLVAGIKFAVAYVGFAQLVYLIGFSYAFFWKGWTGLAIVVVAIITLFILMQATGRVVWNEVFKRKTPAAPPSPPPQAR